MYVVVSTQMNVLESNQPLKAPMINLIFVFIRIKAVLIYTQGLKYTPGSVAE